MLKNEVVFRKRIIAFIIDMLLFGIIFIVINIIPIYDDYIMISSDLSRYVYITYTMSLLIVLIAFLGKDIFGGQSIGKKIEKIKVVDAMGRKASVWRLLLRNITVFIWPIEALLLLMGRKKIGDCIAKTYITEVRK